MNKKKLIAPVVAGLITAGVLAVGVVSIPANAATPITTGQSSHTSNGITYYETKFADGSHIVNPGEQSITNAIKAQKAKDAAQDAAIKAKAAGGLKGDPGVAGRDGAKGDKGDPGVAGPSGLAGAYYAVAKYDVGDTNGGAIATVGCTNPTDVAISGGVQELGLGASSVPVASSFPGRMDWTTNTPKPDRLDGWIVQFNTETGAAPQKVSIYALCVPSATIPVTTTYTESIDH